MAARCATQRIVRPAWCWSVVLRASGCLACCSDGGVAIPFAARVTVSGGTAVGVSCAPGDGLCSGAGSAVWLVPEVRSGVWRGGLL